MSCSLENDELSQPLQQAISKLSPDDRTILMLRVLEEKSCEEIGEFSESVLPQCGKDMKG